MSLIVRIAGPTDVEGIFRVRTSATENVLTLEELAALGITEASVTEMIRGNVPCAWVACEDGRIVGFSMIDAAEGSLFAAFVLPTHEGRGIGRKLVQAAEGELFSKHDVAWLETARDSRAAGFYRHLGWGAERETGGGDIRLEKHRTGGWRG